MNDDRTKLGYLVTGLWMLAGLAPSWIVVDGIFAQIARLDRSQPEGAALATYLGAVSALANSFVVPLYEKLRLWFGGTLAKWSTGVAWSQVFSCLLAAGTWHIHYKGCSIFLYLVMFISSFAGNGQQLALVPWLSTAESAAIAPAMAGGQSGVLFAAGLVAFQDTALKATGIFAGPSFFFVLLAMLLTLSCTAIRLARLQLKQQNAQQEEEKEQQDNHNKSIDNPLVSINIVDGEEEKVDHSTYNQSESKTEPVHDHKKSFSTTLGLEALITFLPKKNSNDKQVMIRLIAWSNAVLQLVSWVLVRSALPYAFRFARPRSAGSDGGAYLEVGVNASFLACFFGAIQATRIRIHFSKLRPWRINGILALASLYILSILAFASPPLHSQLPVFGLIAAAAAVRAIDGFYSPIYYRAIFDLSQSSALVKDAGELAILVVMLGVWIALIIVIVLPSS
uniref:ADP,ATP carrier protein n=1 Tax=Aureoumbra lagunensis TaxID=44058 RepID=A0A7S3JWZ5_9STRA|mmetsp:Transcript_21831/g.33590  ORF Transcript_21831/g.33590 Transcript_21831/m.33590 type:complete len:452 (+) Transcript_21831:34-1389(+)